LPGTFLLGIFVRNTKQKDALLRFAAGILITIVVTSPVLVAWTWFTIIGVLITLFIGKLISLHFEKEK
jgi:hypothetical protein